VPVRNEPHDVLLAIATDLLAQVEAQRRTATRLELAARVVTRGVHDPMTIPPTLGLLRDHVRAMRDLFEIERGLLDEFERELSGASN
jgi:hypothetical protein